jgi:hypothetical protein
VSKFAPASAPEHPHVGEQVVAEVDRLGALQVGVAGQRPVEVVLGQRDERLGQVFNPLNRGVGVSSGEHGHIGRDLVVARAPRVQTPARTPDQFGQAPLDRHVNVLVAVGERKAAIGQLGANPLQALAQGLPVGGRNDALGGEHLGVGDRLIDVVRTQPPVKAQRIVQAPKAVVGGLSKAGDGANYAMPGRPGVDQTSRSAVAAGWTRVEPERPNPVYRLAQQGDHVAAQFRRIGSAGLLNPPKRR